MTQAQTLANLSQDYGVIPMSNRNTIVDGAMEALQGSSTGITGNAPVYTCFVMYMGNAGTGGVATISVQSARINGLGGESGANNLYAHSQTTASTGAVATNDLPYIFTKTEYVNKLAGKSVTLSMKLMTNTGTCTIPSVYCRQNMGSGGTPSANVVLDKTVNWVVTPTQQKFSVRLDLPSVSGNTLGTNINDFTSFGIFFPAGWTGTVYVTEMQVEVSRPLSSSDLNGKGGEPTAFEYRGAQAELARVQRYFYSTTVNQYQGNFPCGFYNTTTGYGKMYLPAVMRATPAGSVSGSGTWYRIINNASVTSVAVNQVLGTEVALLLTAPSGQALAADMISNSSANPFTFVFDARL